MNISYDKLWKLMKAIKMKMQNPTKVAELNSYILTQLGKDAYVSLMVIVKFCRVFHHNMGDVIKTIEDI